MATNQVVQVQVDDTIMAEATASLAKMGLTVSDAVQLMLTRVAHEHTLPFEPLIPNNAPSPVASIDNLFKVLNEGIERAEALDKINQKIQDAINNAESRPPWVSSISSLYASTDASSIEFFYERGKKGMSPDERQLLDTAYATRRAAIFGDIPPSDASMDRLMQLIDQGGYIVAPKIHDDVDKIRSRQGQEKPENG